MDEQRAEFAAWANDAGFNINRQDNDSYLYSATRGAWEAWQAATQRQQERIEELDALVKYLQQEVARVERNRDMWRSQCQHQANALASIRLEQDAAIARATHKEQI